MLPLLLLAGAGGALAGREYYDASQRGAVADAFRQMLGSGGQYVGPGEDIFGTPLEGPPQRVGASGLLGTITDPTQAAYLQLLGKMADVPGVTPQMLLTGTAGAVGTLAQLQEGERERGFRAGESGLERQFRQGERVAGDQAAMLRQVQGQDFQSGENALRLMVEAQQQAEREANAYARLRYSESQANWRHNNPVRGIPQGMTFYPGPPSGPNGTPIPLMGPLPGTEGYVKGVEAVRDARNAVANVDALTESYLLGGQGRQFFGEAAGEQAARFQRLIRDVGKAADLGTLQKADIEFLSQYLPDPTAFFNKLWQGDPRLLKIMETVRGTMAQNYAMKREANPWVVGLRTDLGQDLPAMPTADSVEKKYKAARDRAKADADTKKRLRPLESAPPVVSPGAMVPLL